MSTLTGRLSSVRLALVVPSTGQDIRDKYNDKCKPPRFLNFGKIVSKTDRTPSMCARIGRTRWCRFVSTFRISIPPERRGRQPVSSSRRTSDDRACSGFSCKIQPVANRVQYTIATTVRVTPDLFSTELFRRGMKSTSSRRSTIDFPAVHQIRRILRTT